MKNFYSFSSDDVRGDEAEEARSGDEELVEPEEEPEGTLVMLLFNIHVYFMFE